MNEMIKTPTARTPARRTLLSDGGPMGWIRDEIDRIFDDFSRPGQSIFNVSPRGEALAPPLEFSDEGKEYRLSAELPGLTDKDIQIEMAEGVLTVSGEKKESSERKDNGYLISERRYGSFRRQVALPNDVDPNAIHARFNDGLLVLTLGKDEKATEKSRKIAIES